MDYQNDAPLRATYNDWHRHAGLRESDIDLLNILVNLSPSQRDMAISFLPDQRSLDYIQDISQRVFAIYEFENAELELDDRFSRIEFADLMTVEHFGEEFSAVACAAEPDSRQHMEQIRLHYCENPVSQAGIKPLSAKIASVRHVQRRIRSKAGDVESRKLGLNGVNDMSSTLISGYQPPLLDSESGTLPQRKSASTLLGVENRESAVSVERVSAHHSTH
ncbi:hypothetical protein BC829DRAFT_412737 [Chytridium lagenaria]|nr:hypothetical protein BC829DRAFT_412737 [Chytridium lagenaria]